MKRSELVKKLKEYLDVEDMGFVDGSFVSNHTKAENILYILEKAGMRAPAKRHLFIAHSHDARNAMNEVVNVFQWEEEDE